MDTKFLVKLINKKGNMLMTYRMKRGVEEMDLTLETSGKPFSMLPMRSDKPHDIILYLTKFVDAPACIDIKTYLHWHATCRYLWKEYIDLTPNAIQTIIRGKWSYNEDTNKHSVFYYYEYCTCLLSFAFDLQCMNEKIYQHLQLMREKIRRNTMNSDGLKNIVQLCELSVLDEIVTISYGENVYGCSVLRHSIEWVKLRYGWDLRFAVLKSGGGGGSGNMILKEIKWTDRDMKGSEKLVLVACNNKFHNK